MNKERCRFSHKTKQEALKQAEYTCQICGAENVPLEVHHLIAIWFAMNYCPWMSTQVISDLANAIVVCLNCHAQLHKDESVSIYKCLAASMWGVKKFSKSSYGEGRLAKVYEK